MRFFNLFLFSLLTAISYSANRVCLQKKVQCPTRRVCHGSGAFRLCYNVPNCRLVCVRWGPAPKQPQGTNLAQLESGCKKICTKRVCVKLPPNNKQICAGGQCVNWCPPKKTCTADMKKCYNGALVARDPSNGCQFKPCPMCTKKSLKCDKKKRCIGTFCYTIPTNCKVTCTEYKSATEAQEYSGQVAGIENAESGCKKVCVPRVCIPFMGSRRCTGGQCVNACPPKLPVCPADMKTCPDGKTKVGRDAAKSCAFKPCPACLQKKLQCPTKRVCHGSGKWRFCYNMPSCRLECVKWGSASGNTEEDIEGTNLMTACKKVCTKKVCTKLPLTSKPLCVGGQCFNWCPPKKVCTLDVRKCPNGSSVGRDPLNGCQFKPCPVCAKRSFKCDTRQQCIGNFCFPVPINVANCKWMCTEYKAATEAQEEYTGQVAGIEDAEGEGCKKVCVPRTCTTIWGVRHCIGGQCVNACPPKLPVCPADMKTCPDGQTKVGRDNTKSCAFKPCPACLEKKLQCPTKRVCHGSGMWKFCYNIPNCRLACMKWGPAAPAPSFNTEMEVESNQYIIGGAMIGAMGLVGGLISYFNKKKQNDISSEEYEPLV